MNTEELLLTLFRNGVSLGVEGDSLTYSSEREISPELLQELKQHKTEVIKFLQALQRFGSSIGEVVTTPEGEGIIWGVCCYGVEVVHPGRSVLLYNPIELLLLNGVTANH